MKPKPVCVLNSTRFHHPSPFTFVLSLHEISEGGGAGILGESVEVGSSWPEVVRYLAGTGEDPLSASYATVGMRHPSSLDGHTSSHC